MEAKNTEKNALPANKRARAKYTAETTKKYAVRFNKRTDADVIEAFDKIANKTDFMRQCIIKELLNKAE